MVVQTVIHKESSHLPGSLGHFADSNSIPQNLTTTYHPIVIAMIPMKYRLSLFVRLCQQCHVSRIDEVLKFDDSMVDIHEILQTPMTCP